MKRALITGITGQDGAYLAEFLLKKGYEIHGIKRRSSSCNTGRIDHLYTHNYAECQKFFLHYGDLTDSTNVIRLMSEIEPDEIYNLGAQSHVAVSFETPEYTAQADALGPLRILEAMRILGLGNKTRFYQASTSELYGDATEFPQTEKTPFRPCSPYAVAKLYAYWTTVNYRNAYGFFATNGILFNHESPLRGEKFVTRKITRAVARIHLGLQDVFYLGNLDARRDWGYAGDYVEAMWYMMQHHEPRDWIIATGKSYSVREFVVAAFDEIGVRLVWRKHGIEQEGVDDHTGIVRVRIDKRHFRRSDIVHLIGDASAAQHELGWRPRVSFRELVHMMVHADIEQMRKEMMCHTAKEADFFSYPRMMTADRITP
jgi:GDPmannose 4,6-dehydratase